MAEGLAAESQKALQMEAELEKHLADCDTEREQLRLRLVREENRSSELASLLASQLHRVREQPPPSPATDTKTVQRADRSTAVLGYKNTPPGTPPEVRKIGPSAVLRPSPDRDSLVGDSRAENKRPVPAEKPADLSVRMAAMTGVASSQQPPTMFTTPSGTRITVAVGGGRKPLAGRAVAGPPPPVPPNKPQVVLPPQRVQRPGLQLQQQRTQITVANDKITIASTVAPPVSVLANQANLYQTSTVSTASGTTGAAATNAHLPRKTPPPPPSQVCANYK